MYRESVFNGTFPQRPFVYRPWWGIFIANAKGSTRLSLYTVICKTKYKAFLFIKGFSCRQGLGGLKIHINVGNRLFNNKSNIFKLGWDCSIVMMFGVSHFSNWFFLFYDELPFLWPTIISPSLNCAMILASAIWYKIFWFQASGISAPWKRRVRLRRSIDTKCPQSMST